MQAEGARQALKGDGRLGLGFDLTGMRSISGAQTGCQAQEMEQRVQGASYCEERSEREPAGEGCLEEEPSPRAMLAILAELSTGEREPSRLLGVDGGARCSGGSWSSGQAGGAGQKEVSQEGLTWRWEIRGAAGPCPTCPISPFILPFHSSLPGPFRTVLRVGLWTPGVVMNLGGLLDNPGSASRWARSPGLVSCTSIAKTDDPELKPNTGVWTSRPAGWHTGARVQVRCRGSGPCPGLLSWTFWPPDAGVLGARVQAPLPERQLPQRRTSWRERQLWGQLGLVWSQDWAVPAGRPEASHLPRLSPWHLSKEDRRARVTRRACVVTVCQQGLRRPVHWCPGSRSNPGLVCTRGSEGGPRPAH